MDGTIENVYEDLDVSDFMEQKIDELTKSLNLLSIRLDLNTSSDLSCIRRDYDVLINDNDYVIEDSIFLQNLSLRVLESISAAEIKTTAPVSLNAWSEPVSKNRHARIAELKLLKEEYCERWGPDSGMLLSVHLIKAKEKDILEMDKEIQFLENLL